MACAGLVFALVANQLSPLGLELARDYFPGAARPLTGSGGTGAVATAAQRLEARIRLQGLQLLASDEIHRLFEDPRYAQELIVFVDAREKAQYVAGHIPGAILFDQNRAPDYLPAVLPACMRAEQVVVYCLGGECEDSEFAAIQLRDAGIPGERLWVFGGGINEWIAHGWPVEVGERKGGLKGRQGE